MIVFAPTGDANGYFLALPAAVFITAPLAGLINGSWDLARGDVLVGVMAASALLAFLLYGARWVWLTPTRMIVVRPWLVRRVAWDRVGYCDFSLRFLKLWMRRSSGEGGDTLKLFRADPPSRRDLELTSAAPTRTERRLSAVLGELHRRGVPLDPSGVLWAAMERLEGDDEPQAGDEMGGGDEMKAGDEMRGGYRLEAGDELEGDEDGAAPVDDEAARRRELELEARAAEEIGIDLVETDEPGLFYRPVPLDRVRDVWALWERAGGYYAR